MANWSAEYSFNRFMVSFTAIYKNRKPQQATAINARVDENSFMLNAKLSCSVVKEKLYFFTGLDNVFDDDVSDLLGTELPGRWWTAGFRFSFVKP